MLSIVYTAGVQAVTSPADDHSLIYSPRGVYTRTDALQRQQYTPGGHTQQILLPSPGHCQQRQGQQQRMPGTARALQLPPSVQQAQLIPQSAPSAFAADTFRQLLLPNMAAYSPAAAVLSAQPQLDQNAKQLCKDAVLECVGELVQLGVLSVNKTALLTDQQTGLAQRQAHHQQAEATHATPNSKVVRKAVPALSSFNSRESLWRWYRDPKLMRRTLLTPQQMEQDGDTSWRQGLDKRRWSEFKGYI